MKIVILIIFILSTLQTNACADEPSSERQAELLYLLKHDCGACHGMTLKGGLGPSLLPEDLATKPKELLFTTIIDGRAGTAMPPWRDFLTPEEINWLLKQLLEGIKE
ncbi:cytochrome c [Candidatus Halobeggiatoa sp. HSG11]|nr:cytochrome c [Candidatus Halobeggiatoa sp. HSG11]